MSFQFRFASIMMLRRQQRDETGVLVGKANEAIARVDEQVEEITQQRQSARLQSQEFREGAVSVDRLLSSGRFEMQLDADIQALKQTRAQLMQELERRQLALTAAEAEVKRFERLEENERAEYRAELNRKEQAEQDEVTSSRYLRQRNQLPGREFTS
jgi:flagellar FliJ protein